VRGVGRCEGTFLTREPTFSIAQYPLKNSAILDSGTTIHIFNEISRFLRFRPAESSDFVWAGEDKVRIQGYGNVDVQIQSPKGKHILRLFDVAFCPDFACNLVSLRLLHRQGYWWDNRPGFNNLRRAKDNTIVALMGHHYGQFVLEYLPENLSKSAFFTRRNRFNSWSIRRPVTDDAWRWHLRLGHPGPQALEHLVNCSQGARIRGPTTVECQSCGLSKAKRQIRREPRDICEGPGLHLAVDFHDYELGYGGFTSQMLITDRWSGCMWDYYLQNRTAKSIIIAFKHLFGILEKYYIRPKIIEGDNEIFSQKHELRNFLEVEKHMRIEPSSPYTGPQNGAAERSGGVIKDKSRAMREGAKLPAKLWPEISRAAVYLHNRTPRYMYNWKTPYDRFHTYLAFRDGVVIDHKKPQVAHLKVYGCKAYALTTETLKKANRLQRLNPKAWLGYLVGYDSTNKFRIWNPFLNKVVSTRDVIFDEDSVFDGNLDHLRDDLLRVNLDELKDLLNLVDEPTIEAFPEENQLTGSTDDEPVLKGFDFIDNEPVNVETLEDATDSGGAELMEISQVQDTVKEDFTYPTPPSTPPAALLAASLCNLHEPTDDSTIFNDPIGSQFEV
jgi:GAG-pre-integrase domain